MMKLIVRTIKDGNRDCDTIDCSAIGDALIEFGCHRKSILLDADVHGYKIHGKPISDDLYDSISANIKKRFGDIIRTVDVIDD